MNKFLKAVEKTYNYAEFLLSGTVPTSAFVATGHPLSRKRPTGLIPKLPINEQKGDLKRSLHVKITRTKNDVVAKISLSSDHRFTTRRRGTKRQVARAYWSAVEKKAGQELKKMGIS